jgi:hypothetical protein
MEGGNPNDDQAKQIFKIDLNAAIQLINLAKTHE